MEQKIPNEKQKNADEKQENIDKKFDKKEGGKIKKELKECENLKQEYLAGWQRARADFINYKKEGEQGIKKLLEWEKENLILEILPILDNFELAEKNLDDELKKEQNISKASFLSLAAKIEGFRQIKKQLEEFLKVQGIEEIDVLGKKFDPSTSEAIEEIKEQDAESELVLNVIQKGYQLNKKVIRPARVKISE